MLTDRSRIARSLCSTLAIATALIVGSGTTRAQSFQGNGTVISGGATITTGANITNIDILGTNSDVVINWTTFDTAVGGGPINFQPSGTTATFQSTNAQFTVLNRILPTDPTRSVQFNGTVIGQLQGAASQTPAGTIYFYSPGGLIIGSGAVFNVGALGLTSAAPVVDANGCFDCAGGAAGVGKVIFGAANPGTGVDIQAGAQITGTSGAPGSYLAVVAPRINNAGTISGKRVTALISADAATLTLNVDGLFDIQVDSGTSSTGNGGNGRTLINTGSITGPVGSAGFASRIYLVAVPKNIAITMVIGNGSSLGFNVAGAANVVGNAVILSAGHDVAGGQIVATPSAGGGSGSVMIDSFNANYTSEVVARATGRALFASDGAVGAGSTNFAANLTAHSATIVSVEPRSGGSANITGNLNLDANAFAATPTSSVTAGNAYLDARNGASLTVGGNAVVVATAQGGNATGGNADATADTGGIINIAGVLRVRSEGLGGSGGSGTGGMASVNARAGGDIFANQLNLTAEGVGGDDVGAGAGNGRGGNISLIANGAGSTINIANGNSTGTGRELLFSAARGFGGQSNGGGSGIGGSAIGGNVTISVTNGAAFNGPATVGSAGFNRIFARAFGGDANTGASAGGGATGGDINITVDNATFTSADLLPSSFAQAGSALPTATGTINGGNATGGTRNITVRNGATATTSFSGGGPGAQGGDATASGRGGDASGGNASLVVDNATLTLSGRSVVFSQNISGSGGTAGNVIAGTAYGQVSNGGILNVPDDATSVYDFSVTSNAFGPAAGAVAGIAQGNVTAGNATLLVQGGTINGPGSISVEAGAAAMTDQYSQGGTYLGGQASLLLQGGTISSPTVHVSANADAGAVGAGLSGTGGSATGGTAFVQASGTTTNLTGGQLVVEALGLGGNVLGTGTGGDGTGGMATLRAISAGVLNVSGNAIVTTHGIGGSATGTASSGAGGAGTGGTSRLIGNAGTVVVSGTTQLTSSGSGGNGGASGIAGAGGIGAGGFAGIVALSNVAGSATINLGAVTIGTDGTGGYGGAGSSGGGFGGAGGAGTGGNSQALGAAGNGNLTTGNVVATAFGVGGAGGAGGTGATGGAGGVGGQAVGGSITLGTASFLDNSPTNTGSGTFGTSTENASAFGGNGGAGGSGTIQGVGGNGGSAFDGSAVVLSRGSPVTFNGAVTLTANATGGTGGAGSTAGAGGNATVGSDPVVLNPGGIGVVVTSRFMHPEQPGRLSAGSITGNATASGGSGSTPGASLLANQPIGVEFTNATATINALDLRATAVTPLAGAAPSTLMLANATAAISNLTLNTSGALSLALDTATLNTANLTLSAANFVLPATPPTAFGTINVSNSLSVNTGLNFLTYANFNLAFNAALLVPGSIQVGDVTVNGTLQAASGAVTVGNVSATSVALQGTTGLTTGTITSTGAVTLRSIGQITTATIAGGSVDARSDGGLSTQAVSARGSVILGSLGAVSIGDVTAGIVNPSLVAGEPYSVLIGSGGSPVTVGNITARGLITVGTGPALTTGNISGKDFQAFVGIGPASFGTITTGTFNPVTGGFTPGGRVLIEDQLQFAIGGTFGNYNGELVFAAPTVAAGGSITINGPVSTGSFDASTNLALTTAAISATETIDLFAGGAITTGQLTGGDTVTANAGGALNVAGASAGIVNPSTNPFADYTVGLRSLVSVTAGDLSSRTNIGLSSPGTISVGNLSTGAIVLALAGTGLTTGSITASAPTGRVYLANFSMEALGGVITGNFNPTPILAATPVAINGPIAINGAVTTGTIQANTLQSLSISGATLARQVSALVAGTTLTTGNVMVGDRAIFAAGGAILLGNVDAGIALNTGGLQKIAIGSSNGPVTTGTLSARQDLGIQSGGAITTGNLRGRDVLLLAGGSVTTGGIAAVNGTQPVGRVYIGNFSMANQTSNVFLPFSGPLGSLPIFNLQPVRIGGAITIGGGVSAGSLFGAAAQGISLQSVTTPAATTQIGSGGIIDLNSGGLVTVNGRLAAGHRIDIVSRDIDITQTGSLDALGPDGEILLASDNPNGMFVGDGLTTTTGGYMLSNAEYGRLKAGEIDIVGADIANLATDLTIGNLTINASQLYGANGTALFASGNRDTQTPSGLLRINGAITATGFASDQVVLLASGTVELNAETGSLAVTSSGNSLGGIIEVHANRFHVASDAILAKLSADPLYVGHIDELNAPALMQRPDGVLRAADLDFEVSSSVLIQNTGSRIVPAGFVTGLGSNTSSSNDIGQVGVRPPEGTEFVINGQIQTDTGIVTGKAAFDLLIAELKAEAVRDGKTFASDLTLTSTFNGCVITTGVCAFGGSLQMAPPASELSVIISPVLAASPPPPAVEDAGPGDSSASASDSEAAAEDAESSEDEKKDEGDGDEAASPIAPPTPLISTRALDGNANVVEPVSGAGNPALFGSAVDETTVQGEKP